MSIGTAGLSGAESDSGPHQKSVQGDTKSDTRFFIGTVPAYTSGIVVQRQRSRRNHQTYGNVVVAFEAKTGYILWQKRMANGPVPPAMKTATAMINGDVVCEGALDSKLPRLQSQDGSRVVDAHHSGDIATIRTSDGKIIGKKHIGGSLGSFGPSSPVMVGGRFMFLMVRVGECYSPRTDSLCLEVKRPLGIERMGYAASMVDNSSTAST